MVRLGFHWHSIEMLPGEYNMTYVNAMADFVARLNKYDVYIIMDMMHQDCWSPRFCKSHGVPSFYSEGYSDDYVGNGSKAYPLPLYKPTYNNGELSNCDEMDNTILKFSSCYITYTVGAAAQRLYDNDKGILDLLW